MNRSRFSITLVTVALTALLAIPAAHAQATRTWVSGAGDDANPCSRFAPCKTFAGAISKTIAGGEISVIDAGPYGPVTITQSVTINGDGNLASILAPGMAHGIVVNAAATDKVTIRGISIQGAGAGLTGILYIAGGQLIVENVSISGFQLSSSSRAIDAALNNSGKLLVNNTSITNCEGGIRLATTAGTLQANLDNVRIENTDGSAVEALANSVATIKHSNLSHNFNAGVRTAADSAEINVEDTVLAFNNAGVNAATSGSQIRISNAAIVNNITGITFVAGASVDSAGNNRVDGNNMSTAPNGTYNVE
jgi:Right handed beta helix region